MLASLFIAALLLAALAVVGICGPIRHGVRSAAPHNDLRRAGEHPAPTAYDPGAAYARTAGVTGGGPSDETIPDRRRVAWQRPLRRRGGRTEPVGRPGSREPHRRARWRQAV